jgi:sec-independent protein translocase protein TatB
LVRRLRSGWDSVRAEVERELEIEDLKRTAREAAASAEAAQAEVNNVMRQTREQVATTSAEAKANLADVQKEITQVDAPPKESSHGSV